MGRRETRSKSLHKPSTYGEYNSSDELEKETPAEKALREKVNKEYWQRQKIKVVKIKKSKQTPKTPQQLAKIMIIGYFQ